MLDLSMIIIALFNVDVVSQTHVGKEVFTTNDATKSAIDWVNNTNLSAMVKSEHIEHFLEFVGGEADDRILNHVRS